MKAFIIGIYWYPRNLIPLVDGANTREDRAENFFGEVSIHYTKRGDKNLTEYMSGTMNDRLGESLIMDFIISDNRLEFEKIYTRGHRTYKYNLHEFPTNNVWIGRWENKDKKEEKGVAKCVIVPMPDDWFIKPRL